MSRGHSRRRSSRSVRNRRPGHRPDTAGLADLGLVPPVMTSTLTKAPLGVPIWAWALGLVGGAGVAYWQRKNIEAAADYVTAQAEAAAGAVSKASDLVVENVEAAAAEVAQATASGAEAIATMSKDAVAYAKNQAFKAALLVTARGAAPYADLILAVAAEEKVSPTTIVALGERESRWGAALAADGTGDHVARKGDWLKSEYVQIVQALPAGWSAPTSGGVAVPGPYAIPTDGRGWGRGIMQVDWPRSDDEDHVWTNAAENIRLGVQIYKEKVAELAAKPSGTWTVSADLAKRLGVAAGQYAAKAIPANIISTAAIAAYNAGAGAVRRAYSAAGAAGIDRITTGGDYSSWVGNLVARIESAIGTAGGRGAEAVA